MRLNYHEELQQLQKSILKMGAMVEDVIDIALKSLIERDLEKAKEVIALDDRIDFIETEIEKKCLELIALQQPVGKDLRKIGAILKIITDIERIGDHGVNIARVAEKIGHRKFIKPLIDIPKMGDLTKEMLEKSLDAFINEDVELANKIACMDDVVDNLYKDIYIELLQMLSEDKKIMGQVIHLLFVGRYLERISDHTTNICERVIYMVNGQRKKF